MWCKTSRLFSWMELFMLILLQTVVFSHGYKIFYMNDTCRLASSPLDILIGKGDPNSTGILRAAHYPPYTRRVLTKSDSLNLTGSIMDCSVNLVPPRGYGLILSIRFISFGNNYCTDYLKFATSHSSFMECGPRVDDETESKSYTFGETVTITFHAEYRPYIDIPSGFQLTFTAFNHTVSGVCPADDTFSCNNRNCVWDGLTCDGHNNCGDLSDENPFGEANCGYRRSSVQYFGVFISLFVLVLVTSATCFYCCRRRRTLVYSGTVVHSPLTTASIGSVNYGTYSIAPYSGQQLGTPGLMGQNAYTYPMPLHHTPYPPFAPVGPVGPTSGVAPLQPAPYPSSDTSARPPSPPPPYTQKSSPK